MSGIVFGIIATNMAAGVMSWGANRRSASQQRAWANYNAALNYQAAEWNSQALSSLGAINSSLVRTGAFAEATAIRGVSAHNAAVRIAIAEHNSSLLLNEIENVWQQADLEQFLLQKEVAQIQGQERAAYAAANVMLDVPGDTPSNREADVAVQEDIQSHIIKHNAQIAADRLLNKAASSLWLGQVEAQNILWEGKIQSGLALLRGEMSAIGTQAQAAYDSAFALWQGNVNSQGIITQGELTASAYDAKANQALTNAFFNSVGSGFKAYAAGKIPQGGTDTLIDTGSAFQSNIPEQVYQSSFGPDPTYNLPTNKFPSLITNQGV